MWLVKGLVRWVVILISVLLLLTGVATIFRGEGIGPLVGIVMIALAFALYSVVNRFTK